jgi:hypothetical protein
MPAIESQLVKIEIATTSDPGKSLLELYYQGQIYTLAIAVASHKLDTLDPSIRARTEQQLQQSIGANSNIWQTHPGNRYLLVREVGYYSLWKLESSPQIGANLVTEIEPEIQRLELVRASIWLFQEVWLQLEHLLGSNQLPLLTDRLLRVTKFQSRGDLDRLLSIDPTGGEILDNYVNLDWAEFDRQLYEFTQKKLGRQFGTKLIEEIIQTMPDSLKLSIEQILNRQRYIN